MGEIRMIDVGEKPVTKRRAVARAEVVMPDHVRRRLVEGEPSVSDAGVTITAAAETTAQTGVEMEALTAAVVAALTVYDMTKGLDPAISIRAAELVEKSGGKSG